MGKPNFQRSVTTRIQAAAPDLRFVAFYHAEEERLKACMSDYERRSFIYVLTVDHNETEHYIYVGQSRAQYTRLLNHLHKYEFSHIYLFECTAAQLNHCEAAVIRELKPLFNRNHNPQADRNRMLLSIDYEAIMDAATIHRYLAISEQYNATCLYGFALPGAVFSILEKHASEANCTCSELLQRVLEGLYGQEIADQIPKQLDLQTNLISAKEYGQLNGRSREQINVYCQQNRLPGAFQIARNWVLPNDTRLPEDHRKKGAK